MHLTAKELEVKIIPENEEIITREIFDKGYGWEDYRDSNNSQDYAERVKDSRQGFTCNMLSDLVKARFSLDFTGAISLTEISLLAQVSRRSITNAMNTKDSGAQIDPMIKIKIPNNWFGEKDFYVSTENARTWLEKKDHYVPTAHSDNYGEQNLFELEKSGDFFRVPQARDGSVFSPACATRNGFMIGPKGSEIQYKHFEEALKELKKMKNPYWRRRNSKGRFGIVAGINWKSVPKSEFFPEEAN